MRVQPLMMNISHFIQIFILLLLAPVLLFAQNKGEIKGVIHDLNTREPLVGANIILQTSDDFKGTVSDGDGVFILKEIPFGTYSIEISYLGYSSKVINDIAVYDSKGVFVEIELASGDEKMGEVVVKGYKNPVEVVDPLVVASARSISVEETKRFAGSLGDPSRMALSYAGVNSGRGDNNDLIIRGNSAKYLQWKLEGLEIPNPNHFGVYGSSGGLLNILNSNNIGRSDFYIGAFPAHTGNALAGVFDLSLRNGDPTRFRHSIETSMIGLSVSSEGPLNKEKGSSYILNYRYSALGLMRQLGVVYQAPDYQDVSFKFNLPTKNKGIITVYGFGGLGTWLEEEFFRKIDSTKFSINSRGDTVFDYDEIVAENLNRYNLGVVGIKHSIPIKGMGTLTNHVNVSAVYSAPRSSDINRDDFSIFLESEGHFNNLALRYQPEWVSHLNDKNTIHAGATLTYRAFGSELIEGYSNYTTKTILRHTDNSFLGQAFISYKNTAINKTRLVAGLHYTYFNLNGQHLIEPRLGIEYKTGEKSTLAFASGLHSTTESPEVYLLIDDSLNVSSRNLKLSRSWQNVLSYKLAITNKLFLTAELYHQYLFDIPIAADSSNYSLINEEVSFTDLKLVNKGKGLNYGLDVTLEKFFSRSYYFILSASIYQSEYRLMEPFYRKTKFSNSYTVNALGGKEFRVKENQFLGLNFRATFSGGKPYVPVLLDESIEVGQEVRDEKRAYFQQLPPYIGIDFSLSYKWVKTQTSHEIKLDIFRLYEQNYYDEAYVPEKINFDGSVSQATVKQLQYGEGQTSSTVLPVVYYRLSF